MYPCEGYHKQLRDKLFHRYRGRSLISADIPGLIKESPVRLISITHQPIVIKGEAEVVLKMGSLNTTWKFLVVENLAESVIGADFIEKHHNDSWGGKGQNILAR